MLSELLLTDMHHSSGAAALPLHRRLYESLRRAILNGHLSGGDRLPSSRELTQDLQLSRNTVMAALADPPTLARGSRAAARHWPPNSPRPSSKYSPSPPVWRTSAPFRWRCGNACKTNTGA